MKVVVTSHAGSAQALGVCMDAMSQTPDFASVECVVVIGGGAHGAYHHSTVGNVTTVLAPHNSIDFTGLIAILECPQLRAPAYAYIHDTTKPGPHFLGRVTAAAAAATRAGATRATASFNFPSMNMGIYSHSALDHYRDTIMRFKNVDGDPYAAKASCVANEDIIFRLNHKHHTFMGGVTAQLPPFDYYGNGIARIVEEYACLDLLKIKANWHHRDVYELGV